MSRILKCEYLEKQWELAKNAQVRLTVVDISHRMKPLRMWYSVTLIFISKVKHFLVMHLLYRNCVVSGYSPRADSHDPHGPVVELLLLSELGRRLSLAIFRRSRTIQGSLFSLHASQLWCKGLNKVAFRRGTFTAEAGHDEQVRPFHSIF